MIVDLIFAVLVVLAIIQGFRRGIIIAVFSFIAIFIGLAAALKLSAIVANHLGDTVRVSQKWLPVLSFILVLNLGGPGRSMQSVRSFLSLKTCLPTLKISLEKFLANYLHFNIDSFLFSGYEAKENSASIFVAEWLTSRRASDT